jgi:eukaryotic-like serine/threonine-protein kinase
MTKNWTSNLVEDLGNDVSLEMVQIPGGTFTMGSLDYYDNEKPPHQVTVSGFFMGKYQVTQAQYLAVMGDNPSIFKGEKRPVETVSWDDAVEFCQKLSQKTGRTYRLPSEADTSHKGSVVICVVYHRRYRVQLTIMLCQATSHKQ